MSNVRADEKEARMMYKPAAWYDEEKMHDSLGQRVHEHKTQVTAAALGPGRSVVDAVRELKERVAAAEENARKERTQRLALQGQVQGLVADLDASRANAKQLEKIIAKLNHEDRELRLALENDAKRIEDLEFAKSAALESHHSKPRNAELEKRANTAVAAAEAATARLREEQALHGSMRAQCREAQTRAKVAQELQADAEARAERAERALAAARTRSDVDSKDRAQLEIELSSARDTISGLHFQLKTTSAQREGLAADKADLEAQISALRRDLDAISSLFLVK
ncbi:Hypothetical Protein FCC1311_001252 [Hondaea fermentalgiana]|uniref:Uncharacterized protein n=1 Tax=Hondaea fermentalgiana TaxID=2315210 RepID=A0A2R5FYR8_9STRA|nr:Hypothetical Protein FCC1311_001252 [Hondaea fermentalgiana]|eukprot:GBG23906.1 Hypothetical Protein FCC1311_001252 [Hondaea fermentalgiana]